MSHFPRLRVPDADEGLLRRGRGRGDSGAVRRAGQPLEGQVLGDLERAGGPLEEVGGRLEPDPVGVVMDADNLAGFTRGVGAGGQGKVIVFKEDGRGPGAREPAAVRILRSQSWALKSSVSTSRRLRARFPVDLHHLAAVGGDGPGPVAEKCSLGVEVPSLNLAIEPADDQDATLGRKCHDRGPGLGVVVDRPWGAVALEPPDPDAAEAGGAGRQVTAIGVEDDARGRPVEQVGHLPPGLASGRVAHWSREPQAPVVTDSDPSGRSNRQAADRVVRHLMLGLGVAGDVAEDDLAGLEPQGERVAVRRAGQCGGPAFPSFPGLHGCAGGLPGVVDPGPSHR